MIYKINILPNAEDDLKWFRNQSKKDYLKCFDLVKTQNDYRFGHNSYSYAKFLFVCK